MSAVRLSDIPLRIQLRAAAIVAERLGERDTDSAEIATQLKVAVERSTLVFTGSEQQGYIKKTVPGLDIDAADLSDSSTTVASSC